MIGHHPRIAFPNETEFVAPLMSDAGDMPALQEYRDWLLGDRGFRDSGLIIDESPGFAELCHSFVRQYRQREREEFVGTTVHHHFERLRFLWPEARYIHLLRDGRDVARSFIPMGWAGNVYQAADHWLQTERAWDQLEPLLDERQWIEVRYEELLQDPKRVLRQICAFIGVEYDDAMLSYPQSTTYAPPDPRHAFQWKHKLTAKELGMVESKIGDMLVRRGYGLSGHPLIRPNAIGRLWLRLQSEAYVRVFGLRRYGVWLMAQQLLSRKLGMKSWDREVSRKLDAAIRKYLQ
jgi:hypothetical protein